MTDFVRPLNFALAGSDIARIYANTAVRALVATAAHSLLLWSDFLAASAPKAVQPDWRAPIALFEQALRMQPFGWMAAPGFRLATEIVPAREVAAARQEPAAPGSLFASYRSAGGHATAQVIFKA